MKIHMNCKKVLAIVARSFWLLWLLTGAVQAQAILNNPDAVYPYPDLYMATNVEGVNLMSGDLNLEIPLATLQGRTLGFTLQAFYNSVAHEQGTIEVDNVLGSNGWKLLDYPKVVQDAGTYYFLDGKRRYPLQDKDTHYAVGDSYYLWQFTLSDNTWTIRTEDGTVFRLGNTSIETGYDFWHLSQMQDSNWGDVLTFTYIGNRLESVQSQIRGFLDLQYDDEGHLVEILNYYDYRSAAGHMRNRMVLDYHADGRLSSMKSEYPLPTHLFEEDMAGAQFLYDAQGRIEKIVSGSGSVKTYTYYTGANHPEIQGKVIRYQTDNGYATVTGDSEKPATGRDDDASYSAIWYDIGNEQNTGTYQYFNKVRVYQGGFRTATGDPTVTTQIYNPFGHQTHYFFNGNTRGNLTGLPMDYPAVDVTSTALRGTAYQSEQYKNDTKEETPADLVSRDTYAYGLQAYHGFQVALLNQSTHTEDQVEDQSVIHTYEPVYLLPQTTIYSRRNPKKEDPDYKEYTKSVTRYAWQDYAGMSSDHLLTSVSQSYTATAPYSGTVSPTDPSLSWEVTSASIDTWKEWATPGWGVEKQYTLKRAIAERGNFLSGFNAGNWLQTSQVNVRNEHGTVTSQTDAEDIVSTTALDNVYQMYPVAIFYNADLAQNEAGYQGWEAYESDTRWSLSGGAVTESQQHTGKQAYGGTGAIQVQVRSENFDPPANTPYVFGAFVKNMGSSTGILQFLGSNTVPIHAGDTQWQYISVVMDHPGNSNLPTLRCTDCYVDDIRFHPLEGSFSANVYQDKEISPATVDVTAAGTYQANDVITVKSGTTIASGQTLEATAGQSIEFESGTEIIPGATVDIYLSDFSLDMAQPVATLGVNGETYRPVYDAFYQSIASVGPDEQLRELSISYNSPRGISIFGDSDPDDHYFDKAHPNMGMQLTAREGGTWEGFEHANDLLFGNLRGSFEVSNGALVTTAASSGGLKWTAANLIHGDNYAIYTELLPNGLAGDQEMGVSILYGATSGVRLAVSNSAIALLDFNTSTDNGDLLASQALDHSPEHFNLLLVVMDGEHLFAYANGRFLFDHTFTEKLDGDVRLESNNQGGAFDNFMYLQDPLIGKQTFDALGQPKQLLVHNEPDEFFVSETLYGDHLNLPMAGTRPTHVSTGGGGLSFRENFANLEVTNSEGKTSLEVTGEVKDEHQNNDKAFTSTRTYDEDPTLRSNRTGAGGAFTVGGGHATQHDYAANELNNDFGYGEDDFRVNEQIVPYTNTGKVDVKTYQGLSTGATFATAVKDGEEQRIETEEYDAQMRRDKHYQPNAYDNGVAGSENFYTEAQYNFLGSVTYQRDPDNGSVFFTYDEVQRMRLRLDAEGAKEGYYQYWKYDKLGRVTEEGVYEDPGGMNLPLSDTTASTISETVVSTLTTNSTLTGKTVDLKAGVRIDFQPGFDYEAQPGHQLEATIVTTVVQELTQADADNTDWPLATDSHRKVKREYHYDQDSQHPESASIGRLVTVTTYEEAGVTNTYSQETYVYDLLGNTTAVIQEVEDQLKEELHASTIRYTYNLLGQPETITQDIANATNEVAYEAVYNYDRLGRIKSIGNLSNPALFAAYEYDNGIITEKLKQENGDTYKFAAIYTSNEEGLPNKIQYVQDGTTLLEEELFYATRKNGNPGYFNGNIAGINLNNGTQQSYEYYYDGFGQLLNTGLHNGSASNSSNTYDDNGNIKTFRKTVIGTKRSPDIYHYYPGTNQLSEVISEGEGTKSLNYDLNGRLTEENGNMQLTYERFSGLTCHIYQEGTTLTYTYGSHHQRIRKTVVTHSGQRTIDYIHGLNDYPLIEVVREADGTQKALTYIYGMRGMIAMQQVAISTTTLTATATMESEFASTEAEALGFENLDASRMTTIAAIDHTGLPANATPEVARLNGAHGMTKGPGKWIKVNKGDVIKAEVYAKYLKPTGLRKPSAILANSPASTVAGSAPLVTEGIAHAATLSPVALLSLLENGRETTDEAPKASLNYYLFDEDMQPLDAGLEAVSTGAAVTEASLDNPHEKLEVTLTAPQDGFVFVNTSHDAVENVDVFFDDLTVVHSSMVPTGWYYPLRDHLGSTRALADANGAIVARYDYDAFGQTTVTKAPPAGLEVHYLYTGQEYEPELEAYNYRARMYDPSLGRFYTPDPAAQQNSAYAYVGNNPISRVDPNGEWFLFDDVIATVGGAIVGAGIEIVSGALSGDGVNWKKVGVAAVAGAAAGETGLYAGPIVAGAVGGAIYGAGAAAVDGKSVGESLEAGAIGAVSGAVLGVAGKYGGRVVGAVARRSRLGRSAISGLGNLSRSANRLANRGLRKIGARQGGRLFGRRLDPARISFDMPQNRNSPPDLDQWANVLNERVFEGNGTITRTGNNDGRIIGNTGGFNIRIMNPMTRQVRSGTMSYPNGYFRIMNGNNAYTSIGQLTPPPPGSNQTTFQQMTHYHLPESPSGIVDFLDHVIYSDNMLRRFGHY
ncbi:MAG: RHS repeat-associated core domain-containing protein [Bacteroidota bacterium]